jgi:hypothetical protein
MQWVSVALRQRIDVHEWPVTMSLTPAQYEQLRRLAAEKDEAINAAERVYRFALMDFNEGIRKARRVFDDAVDAAEAKWRAEMENV